MAVNDVYKADIYYNVGSELTQNVIHLREITACTSPVPALAVCSAVQNKWIEIFETAMFSDEVYVPLVRAIRISPSSSVPNINILGATTINGTGTGDPIPSASALLLSLYTNTFLPTARGRIYIPGMAVENQDDGQLKDAAITLANAMAIDLVADWTPTGLSGEWELVVWSRKLSTAAKVTQVVPHSNLATQRGRRNFPGIGA